MCSLLRRLSLLGWLCLPLLVHGASAVPSPKLPLDAEQSHWLDAHRTLRVGLVLQQPYAQLDRRLGQLSGVNVDLMNWLANAMQAQLTWRNYTDQAALEQGLRAGEVDLAPGLAQTPAGLKLWQFSDPYLRVPQLLVGERNGEIAIDLEKLSPIDRVAVRMPGAVADYLRNTYSHLNLQGVPLERQALQLLLSQQARYAVVDEAQWGRLSREAEFDSLMVVGDIGYPQLLRVATRRDWPQLAHIVTAALESLPARDLERLHERWLQPQSARLSESRGFWQNLCLLLALIAAVNVVSLIWQRRQVHALERQLLAAREDLAQRTASEEALRVNQFSIEQSTVGILWVNWDSHVRYANRAAERMLGYGTGAVVDKPLVDFEPGLSMDRWLNLWRLARTSEDAAQTFETQCVRADGSILPTDVSLSFLRFREAEYLVVYLTDVTERRRALAALQHSEAQLRELSAHLETVREEEKARIAREVHDELGQILTVLKLETSMCELAYADLDSGLRERLNSMKRLIAQLFQQVRDVATALRPPILDAGIASAIEWQAHRFEERTQIPCLVSVPEQLPALDDAKAVGLFRILQEALTNVIRHAQAHTVQIDLSQTGHDLHLSIVDDGCGFDPAQVSSLSFGLVGMRERVLMLGGRLELSSQLGEGTALTVTVPLTETETETETVPSNDRTVEPISGE
ncbi:transporter substrate-binding domain-containing protein [Pseudomonas putida]|nr:transporter substrate-binding domain-containing protein [Pseudomonas putida]